MQVIRNKSSLTVKSVDIMDLTIKEFTKLQMGLMASIEKQEGFLKNQEKMIANYDERDVELFGPKEEYVKGTEETITKLKELRDLLDKLEIRN